MKRSTRAGDTSFGKSSWLIAIADDNIRFRKKRVLIVSTEECNKTMVERKSTESLPEGHFGTEGSDE
jgi:predicted ATP-dependent serine protease